MGFKLKLKSFDLSEEWIYVKKIVKIQGSNSFPFVIFRLNGPRALRGHLTFRILSLLRSVVDIVKSSQNSIFLNQLKTDKREAYQSSTIRLFCALGPSVEKLQNVYGKR